MIYPWASIKRMESEKAIKNNPMFLYLAVLTICSTIGLQTWLTLFNNFAVDIAGLHGNHVGVIQSVREIPGFLALLGRLPSYAGLIVTTLVMSFGFHYYETTNMSLTLQYFDKNASPWVFGKQRSYAAAASIANLPADRWVDNCRSRMGIKPKAGPAGGGSPA
jgi:hypothetical protein